MNRFLKEPSYLLIYCVKASIFFFIANILLYFFKGIDFKLNFTFTHLLLFLSSFLFCALPSSILHNCAHKNITNRLLNNVAGEICGTIMLYGFKGFSLGHMFHHKYPDNPDYDVHPPHGYTFFNFLLSPVKDTLKVVENVYLSSFGDNIESRKNLFLQKIFFNASIILKVIFWPLLLGFEVFISFYLPIYLLNIFVFAHINYATHIKDSEGQCEIINLTDSLYYKAVNILSFGGYYHKNHHLRPQLFNPSMLNAKNDPLYTYKFSNESVL